MGVGHPKICSFIKRSEIHDSFLFCSSTAPSFPDLVFFHPFSLIPFPLPSLVHPLIRSYLQLQGTTSHSSLHSLPLVPALVSLAHTLS